MISLSIILVALFAMFKIAGFIAWPWFVVVSPILIAFSFDGLIAWYCWHEITGRWRF